MAEPLLGQLPSAHYDYVADNNNAQTRKMKPLPKRRRVSNMLFDASDIAATQAFLAAAAAAADQGHDELTFPGNLPGSLSDYYIPLLAGMQDMLRADLKYTSSLSSTQNQPSYPLPSHPPPPPKEEEDHSEYVDHLEQPGNTKKRKVPLARQLGYPAEFIGGPDIQEADLHDLNLCVSSTSHEADQIIRPPDKSEQLVRKDKLPKATRAWLSNKDLQKSRKRQLTAVLGTAFSGDSPALDHVLSTVRPFAKVISNLKGEDVRIRLSRRPLRVAARRSAKMEFQRPPLLNKLINQEFTFEERTASESMSSTTHGAFLKA